MTSAAALERYRTVVLPYLGDGLALALWLTASQHDAEDIVQDACIRALGAIENYDGRGARAWFLAIVRNTSLTWLSKKSPKGSMLDVAALEGSASAVVDAVEVKNPETVLFDKLDEAALELAIATLPPTFREVVVLRDVGGLSYKEIAAMLSLPIGTVMSRLARGRGLLAAELCGSSR